MIRCVSRKITETYDFLTQCVDRWLFKGDFGASKELSNTLFLNYFFARPAG